MILHAGLIMRAMSLSPQRTSGARRLAKSLGVKVDDKSNALLARDLAAAIASDREWAEIERMAEDERQVG